MEQQESIARIKAAIAMNGLKQYEVAQALGCSEQILSMYLSKRRRPPEEFERKAMQAIEFLTGLERTKRESIEEWRNQPQPAA